MGNHFTVAANARKVEAKNAWQAILRNEANLRKPSQCLRKSLKSKLKSNDAFDLGHIFKRRAPSLLRSLCFETVAI
jgi:hypothetical protein